MAYGLDMTPEMLELARKNQAESGLTNVEFLEGTIERIPLPNETADVVISNCVVNLSPDKDAVIREAFRVLKPGGRLAIADIVVSKALSTRTRGLIGLWSGCVSGALVVEDYQAKLEAAGFTEVSVKPTREFRRRRHCLPRDRTVGRGRPVGAWRTRRDPGGVERIGNECLREGLKAVAAQFLVFS